MPKSPTDRRHFIIVGVLVVIATVLMDILLKQALPLPVQASIESLTIDQLIGWHLTIIAFLFSLIVVFMLYSVVLFRRRPDDDSDGAHFEGNTALEIVWTVVPLIFVVVFTFIGIDTLSNVTRAEENERVVQLRAFQWSWAFEYPEGFIAQELVLPINERARMEMTSTDVLHSFWIPEMRVKQDIVPGITTVVRFTPIMAGEYKLRCSELCGLSHWSMLAPVRILEADEYEAWVAERTAGIAPAVAQVEEE
ncbi:MAG: cytochrome c oxidase subunit II [Litorilinea sp.]